MVRQARQTFGETLPKDYLSIEEYVIYERLYGPPLRETKPEDLEYLPEGEDEVDPDKVRNVLLKQNAMGDYEEIEDRHNHAACRPGIDRLHIGGLQGGFKRISCDQGHNRANNLAECASNHNGNGEINHVAFVDESFEA